jgi:hypothetical protein
LRSKDGLIRSKDEWLRSIDGWPKWSKKDDSGRRLMVEVWNKYRFMIGLKPTVGREKCYFNLDFIVYKINE